MSTKQPAIKPNKKVGAIVAKQRKIQREAEAAQKKPAKKVTAKPPAAKTPAAKAPAARETASRGRAAKAKDSAKDGAKESADWPPQTTAASRGNGQQAPEPVQTGARAQPGPPQDAEHLDKPGLESDLQPRPNFIAPAYRGSGKLEGMTALITGGDSGIGRAIAVLFAREGADVAIVYLSEDSDATETVRCVEAEGRRAIRIAGDVKEMEFCQSAVEQVLAAFGKLDILVNNAAFQEQAATLDDLSEEHFDETVKTNLYGYFHMAKAAVRHLKPGSAIINTGSETGLLGSEKLLDYSATKGAIHAFTKALASNLIAKGIRVNAVAPGPVWTPLNPADKSAEDLKKFGAKTPMKRPAQPEELSPAYVFLASPVCASYITGVILPVMGGVTGGT